MNRIAKFEKVSREQFEKALEGNPLFGGFAAAYDDIKLPERATAGSAGYDFYCPFDLALKPGDTALIPTGIRSKIDDGWVLMMFPRSGLGFKFRVRLNNTVGVIDSDYYGSDNEGHIMLKITNEGDKLCEVKAGQGIAQGIFLPYGITVDDSAEGVRNGGFGSTTK